MPNPVSGGVPDAIPGLPPRRWWWVGGWQTEVHELWVRVAAQRGIDFELPPHSVAAARPSLAAAVEQLTARMDGRDRRWFAAGLATLCQPRRRSCAGAT